MIALVAIGCFRTDGGHFKLEPYVSIFKFECILEGNIQRSRQVLDRLRQVGVTDESLHRLEVFFYTNLESNAVELESTLKKRGYDVNVGEFEFEDESEPEHDGMLSYKAVQELRWHGEELPPGGWELGFDTKRWWWILDRDVRFSVIGLTTPVRMDETTVVQWAEDMCRTGFAHDCEFDGWGTLVNQPKETDEPG